ncbi:Cystatin Precursor [Collichthys lucidus]|uniref:Cystatin n=1 Tax=Collichthys lucidus TaxID=240159 RepID=A0A4U5VBF2_COLLU|nr:Cystatin Precursor [Collichthys lucidus]
MSVMWKIVLAVFAAVLAVSSAGLIGGFQDIGVNDVGVQNALNAAVVQHNRESNAMCPSEVLRVVKARRQLVAGYNYVITTKMIRTACRGTGENAVRTMTNEFLIYFCHWVLLDTMFRYHPVDQTIY